MTATLVVEIISALIALACLSLLAADFVRFLRAGGQRPARTPVTSGAGHTLCGLALLASALVHGIAATAYDSGAPGAVYALGWLSLLAFAASGASMIPCVKRQLPRPRVWHIRLFCTGMVLFCAHVVAARL